MSGERVVPASSALRDDRLLSAYRSVSHTHTQSYQGLIQTSLWLLSRHLCSWVHADRVSRDAVSANGGGAGPVCVSGSTEAPRRPVPAIRDVSETCLGFSPALSSQAGRHPAEQELGCEGQGEGSSRLHPQAGELLQAEEPAAITSQCSRRLLQLGHAFPTQRTDSEKPR